MGKSVELNMTEALGLLVDEATTLPPEIIDIMMAQFLRMDPHALNVGSGKAKKNGVHPTTEEKQATLIMKALPPADTVANTNWNSYSPKMARYVGQYFNDVIVGASTSSTAKNPSRTNRRSSDDLDETDNDDVGGPTEEDLKDLRKAHRLLRELWRACPAVLQNVIPQLEAELSAENVQLRFLATETLGDIISGIGAAGLPPSPVMDPSAYPPVKLSDLTVARSYQDLLTKPCSPVHFPRAYSQAYSNFLGRRKDKSAIIRSAWTTAIGRILGTSAGGVGLTQQEEEGLIVALAQMMADADEKVRIAAIKVVANFTFQDVIIRLGSSGGVSVSGSVLGTLAERVRDRKHTVRVEATKVLSRIWGVAAGEIAAGEEKVISAVGAAPTRILDSYYANDMEINVLLDHVIFEQLLPLNYPPIKAKNSKSMNGNTKRTRDSQVTGDNDAEPLDLDKIRTERILVLIKNLDDRSKKVFLAFQSRQLVLAKVMTAYLQRCEDYNVSIMPPKRLWNTADYYQGRHYGRERDSDQGAFNATD